jgi:UDP-glucose 4-epimerase
LLQELQKKEAANFILALLVRFIKPKICNYRECACTSSYVPYGNTKQIGEEIISDTAKVTGINSILLRYFNPIGAHPSAAIGELPIGIPQNLVPFITQTGMGLRKELSVYGADYPLLTAIRDYIHVVDLAKAQLH